MAHRITDLTLTIAEGMQTFPTHWHPFVEITQLGRHGIENRETRKVVLGTHTGTHMDAPRHFIPDGTTIDQVLLDQTVGDAVLVDFSRLARFHEVSVGELEEALGGRWAPRIVLRYDWSDQLGTMAYYTDHPFLGEATAQWLVDRGCRVLAMDTPMPDNPKHGRGCPKDSPNHKTLLGNGVVLVEYLTNLRNVRAPRFTLVAAPLKIKDGDGAPARCFAIETD
jgi:arylformamidase